MKVKKSWKIILLIVAFIVVVKLTSILFANYGICDSCGNKYSGTYFVALNGSNLCATCGAEYYTGWTGDLDSVIRKTKNTTVDILQGVEIALFVAALFWIGMKKGSKDKAEEVAGSIKEKILTTKEAVAAKIEPTILKKETVSSQAKEVKGKAEALREIKELLDEGILSQEEFETEKKRILEQ